MDENPYKEDAIELLLMAADIGEEAEDPLHEAVAAVNDNQNGNHVGYLAVVALINVLVNNSTLSKQEALMEASEWIRSNI